MKCTKCQNETIEGQRFCGYCGMKNSVSVINTRWNLFLQIFWTIFIFGSIVGIWSCATRKPWTEQELIQSCRQGGGKVLYHNDGTYFDCDIGGRLNSQL